MNNFKTLADLEILLPPATRTVAAHVLAGMQYIQFSEMEKRQRLSAIKQQHIEIRREIVALKEGLRLNTLENNQALLADCTALEQKLHLLDVDCDLDIKREKEWRHIAKCLLQAINVGEKAFNQKTAAGSSRAVSLRYAQKTIARVVPEIFTIARHLPT